MDLRLTLVHVWGSTCRMGRGGEGERGGVGGEGGGGERGGRLEETQACR